RTGNLLYVSGHIARREGRPWVGQLGAGLTTDEGKAAARAIAIELMGTLQAAVGDLDRIARIVKLMVLVNSAPTFTEQHLVASGAGRSWNLTTLLVVPLPPSMWKGARVLTVDHSPRPFQPPLGSSIRPSSHFV